MTETATAPTPAQKCQAWLNRWDADELVPCVEMGGLGPGYEQCIQIAIAELVRHMLEAKYDATHWKDKGLWDEDAQKIETAAFEIQAIKDMRLSGAQFGAALECSAAFYMLGPDTVRETARIDRRILARKKFP